MSHHPVLFHQLDDLNVLGDALSVAAREDNAAQVASLRDSMARYAQAVGWLPEPPVTAVLAYVEEHREFEEDLFGPAFILKAVARAECAAECLSAVPVS